MQANSSNTTDSPGFFGRLRRQINRGESWLTYDLGNFLPGRGVDAQSIDELEEALLLADVGIDATTTVIDFLRAELHHGRIKHGGHLKQALTGKLLSLLQPCVAPLQIDRSHQPFVILVVGVNGAGKTTTIAKLAKRFSDQGLSVMLAAGDTFRAAAVEQLQTWGERHRVPVISQGQGADSASVIFDAVASAKARRVDVLIADTAGRLHTQHNLMEELKKVQRVMQKQDPSAPHETLLVLDATTGQNALNQAQQFHEAMQLSGMVLTKLDGTARGGTVFSLATRLGLPIRFIGVGEKAEDLGEFNAGQFIDALFQEGLHNGKSN